MVKMFRTIAKILLLCPLTLLGYTCCCSSTERLPLVINTWAFTEANTAAWNIIRNGGSALEALVEGCTTCESLQCDGTVGYGGSPDETGDTTLDAMIMDGGNMNIGAVAGMRDIKSASLVARLVLEHTKHSLLVGEAATKFAVMMGLKRESLKTPKSQEMWQEWLASKCQPNFWQNVKPDPSQQCGPYKPQRGNVKVKKNSYYSYKVDRWNHDTIGMIVIDKDSQIYAGTSTNGAKHKIPGRVGDSPIPGAGAYADNEVGAAVATGDGDIMMRFLPSFLAVESLRMGLSPKDAANKSMERIVKHYPRFSGGLVVVDKGGNFGAACVGIEKFPYSVAYKNEPNTKTFYENCIEHTFKEL